MATCKPTAMPPEVAEWSMRYTMAHQVVPLVRLHARRQLVMWRWPGDQQEATLIVSELVTNAINHGRVVGHMMTVRLAILEDGGLLIDVSDPVPGLSPSREHRGAADERECGRGLDVIRALGGAVSWFLRDGGGKTVRVHLSA
ncbi:ATP-binding protein [Streptomyces sp. NPDC002795]|uniref:ATP-binding protein n=1 Tax=Streptomyces sp. NPDC002795 TaxID=3364665 RepID=UPI0036C4F920